MNDFHALWLKWVRREYPAMTEANLKFLAGCIGRELRAAIKGHIRCSPGLVAEMRAEAIRVGKMRAALRK